MTLRILRLFPYLAAAALSGAVLLGTLPPSAGAVIERQAVTQTVLPNGLRVVIKEAPSINLVAVNMWVRAGSADETEENNGVSHFLEHLMFKGTEKRGPGEFQMEIEGLGAMANAASMEDATQYYVVAARPFLDQALEALGDVMTNPTFPEEELERERRVILNELAGANENPAQILSDWVSRLSFQKHPYRLPTAGTRDSVRGMTREKIVAFYNQYYVASNMTLVLVGAVQANEVLPKIEAAFAGLRPGPAPERAVPAEPPTTERPFSVLNRPDVDRGYLMFGFRGPGMDAKEDVCAMDVLLFILGEQRAQGGRLNREVRQKHELVSAVWCDYVTQRQPGLVTIWADTVPEKVDAARDAILEQLALVRDGLVPEDEIERAKLLLLGIYTLDNETYDGQAGTLGFYDAKDTYEFALEYEARIRKVRAEDIQRVARTYLAENAYSLAVLKPKTPEGVADAPSPSPMEATQVGEAP